MKVLYKNSDSIKTYLIAKFNFVSHKKPPRGRRFLEEQTHGYFSNMSAMIDTMIAQIFRASMCSLKKMTERRIAITM